MTEQLANTILNKIFELSTKIDTVATVVKRHDETTFPDIQKELKQQSNALFRMESKQNKDILQFVQKEEKIQARLVPLEAHVQNHKEIKSEDKKLWVDVAKHTITIIISVATTLIGINIKND